MMFKILLTFGSETKRQKKDQQSSENDLKDGKAYIYDWSFTRNTLNFFLANQYDSCSRYMRV